MRRRAGRVPRAGLRKTNANYMLTGYVLGTRTRTRVLATNEALIDSLARELGPGQGYVLEQEYKKLLRSSCLSVCGCVCVYLWPVSHAHLIAT